MIRSKTILLSGSGMKARGSSAKKGLRTSSRQRMTGSAITSMKDPKLAAVAHILDKKKATQLIDSDHKPMLGAGAIGGLGLNSADKAAVDKLKRAVIGSAAPTKVIKLIKPANIAFKTTETKVIKKE